MYVKIGNYKNYITSWDVFDFVLSKIFKMKDKEKVEEIWNRNAHMLEPFLRFLNKDYLSEIERKSKIKISADDLYSLDYTLSLIIEPLLKQFKENISGCCLVDNEDVPAKLRMTKRQREKYDEYGDTDKNFDKRYEYILDEMIWAFGEVVEEGEEHSNQKLYKKWAERKSNGFRLFGKYFESLWM